MKEESVLVLFGDESPYKSLLSERHYDAIVAKEKWRQDFNGVGSRFISLESLIEAGSIYEASAFVEELSFLKLADGSRITKSFIYEGYELWWIYYNNLFLYFCLPYTQYRKLLKYLKSFPNVYIHQPPYKSLFSCYLEAHGCKMSVLRKSGIKSPSFLPFGVFLQILITLVCLPVLVFGKRHLMVFTGDKFEKDRDYDFRMKFVYEELRQREIPFVEFIRSLESWKNVLGHAWKRRRAVIYPEAVAFAGRFISFLIGGHRRARREFSADIFMVGSDPEAKFKSLVAIQYLLSVYDDVWAIRITKFILRVIGVKVSFIPSASERNFHAVLGSKLNGIPTVGIMHGVASRFYNVYEFMPGFDGEKILSVDKYGLWSEWWLEYFREYSRAYKSEQLFLSGPMRPILNKASLSTSKSKSKGGLVKVLFVSEQQAVPEEVLPYLLTLLDAKEVSVYMTFRPYRDGFELWLKDKRSDILGRLEESHIIRSGIHDAIAICDVVVGAHSTSVIEALLNFKVSIYFKTQKWGDYYNLKDYDKKHSFFAENPDELVEKIKNSRAISPDAIKDLRERYFGDPYKNGSKWVVDQLEGTLLKGCSTK